jgi:hypothetical protein
MKIIEKIIDHAELPPEDKLPAASVRNAAFLRVSDTFKHSNDEIRLRGDLLGTLYRREVLDLLEKEERIVEIVRKVVSAGERLLIYTGNTQKIDMRGPLKRIIAQSHPNVTVEVLPDSVSPAQLVRWFETVTAQVAIVSFHRVATGLNLSQFNNLAWFDYTDNTRLAEQGEGRIRRVNTADIHRAMFGEVRPVRYWYLTSSKFQEAQLAYTLEKRMVAKLAEGETPDIDPAECTSGNQSFSALITRALKEGDFDYQDPSVLLKKMTRSENANVRNSSPPAAIIHPTTQDVQPEPTESDVHPEELCMVLFVEHGQEIERKIPKTEFSRLFDQGLLDITLFGIRCHVKKAA